MKRGRRSPNVTQIICDSATYLSDYQRKVVFGETNTNKSFSAEYPHGLLSKVYSLQLQTETDRRRSGTEQRHAGPETQTTTHKNHATLY